MRTVLALGLSISLCTSALAAPLHRPRPPRVHLRSLRSLRSRRSILRSDQAATDRSGFAIPGWTDEQTQHWMDNATTPNGIPASRPNWLDHATTPNGLDVSRPNLGKFRRANAGGR
jgi:hypothetical protein